jgi:O-antigen ligase
MFSNIFTNKFYLFSLTALSFSIPIHNRLTVLIIAIVGLFWLVEFNYKEKFRLLKKSKPRRLLLSFSILYLLYIVGIFYSDNIYGYNGGALFNIEKRMSLFVFPLLFSTIKIEPIKNKLYKQIQKAFILGSVLSIFFLVNMAFYNFIQTNDTSEFYYSKLAQFHHPSYLALYYAFCIIILLNWLMKPNKRNPGKRNAIFILIFLFQLMIVLLSSKAGILGILITYLAAFIYVLINKKEFKRFKFLIPVGLMLIFLFTLLLNPGSYGRFYSVEKAMESPVLKEKSEIVEGTVARIFVWKSSLEIIKENPLLGVGTGDARQALLEKYEEKNQPYAYKKEYNAHNEYLQTFITIGVFGFLVLIVSILFPAWFAFRQKHLVYLLFLILLAFHFMVESMLAKQAGIVFYAFFNAVLFYQAFVREKVPGS